jgi:hypothetical protein
MGSRRSFPATYYGSRQIFAQDRASSNTSMNASRNRWPRKRRVTSRSEVPGDDANHEFPCVAKVSVDLLPNTPLDTSRDEEARMVAEICSRLIGKVELTLNNGGRRRLTPGDIALLAPVSTQLWRYERALEEAGLPFASQAGKNLFKRQEAQDLVALVRSIADVRDTLALGALLRGPLVGLSEQDLLTITASLPVPAGSESARLSLSADRPDDRAKRSRAGGSQHTARHPAPAPRQHSGITARRGNRTTSRAGHHRRTQFGSGSPLAREHRRSPRTRSQLWSAWVRAIRTRPGRRLVERRRLRRGHRRGWPIHRDRDRPQLERSGVAGRHSDQSSLDAPPARSLRVPAERRDPALGRSDR